MTERERWTVYPLLFLTLGIAAKDKMISLVDAKSVRCGSLYVTDRAGNEQLVLTRTDSGVLVRANQLLVSDRNGKYQVEIGTTPAGGIVKALDKKGRVNVALGHAENMAFLVFTDAQGNVLPNSIIAEAPRERPRQEHEANGPGGKKTPAEATPPEPAPK